MKKLFTAILILVSVTLFAQQRNMSVGVVDTKPVFPGCEVKAELDTCFDNSVKAFINDNFNFEIANALELTTGKHFVHVGFVYNTSGAVEMIRVQGAHPSLEAEAKRVINLLPAVTPASHEGKKVGVVFNTSIIVTVD